jgi:ParB/RepB/Spo0J family partition protein
MSAPTAESALARRIRERRERAIRGGGRSSGPGLSDTSPGSLASRSEPNTTRTRADQADPAAVILRIDQLEIRSQARRVFKNLDQLAANIRRHGQHHPIVVTPLPANRYLLIAGERRVRAVRDILKRETIAARICEVPDDAEAIRLLQLSENIHRDDYEPLDLARELAALKAAHAWTLDELADRLHRSKGWASKKLSLLEAPVEVQAVIAAGELAETEYFNHKTEVLSQLAERKGLRGGADLRTPMVTIPVETARRLAALLQTLATRHGANPITLDQRPTKKALVAILTTRTSEIGRLVAE